MAPGISEKLIAYYQQPFNPFNLMIIYDVSEVVSYRSSNITDHKKTFYAPQMYQNVIVYHMKR